MRQEDVHPASCTKTKLTVVSSCTPPNRCLSRRQRRAVQAVCCRRQGISDFPSRIAPDVCVPACSLLHSSRKFLYRELQLTPVLTEVTCTHPSSFVTRTIVSVKLLAIIFISHPDTRSTHSFAFVVQSHLRYQDLDMSRVCLDLPSFASLGAWRIVSQVYFGGLLLARLPSPHWVPTQLSS